MSLKVVRVFDMHNVMPPDYNGLFDSVIHISQLDLLVCLISIAAAFSIFALMIETTPRGSPKAFFTGDRDGIWAMIRRFVYLLVIFGLFGQAMFILDGKIEMNIFSTIPFFALAFPWLFFMLLRWLGVVSQDRWLGFRNRSKAPL